MFTNSRILHFTNVASRLWHQFRRGNEIVKMAADDLLDDDVGMLLLDHCGIEIVLPQVDGAAEVFRKERYQRRDERVAKDDRPRPM